VETSDRLGHHDATDLEGGTLRIVRCWNKLFREAVAAPSLVVFKARLDGASSNLV